MPQDDAEAVKWYRKAVEQGNAKAQLTLGICYYNCDGVPQDTAEALKLYRKAAEQGQANGQYNLGASYAKGHGVPLSLVTAYMWATGKQRPRLYGKAT